MALQALLLWPVLGLAAVWTLLSCVGLFRNYMAARQMGVPIRVLPIDHTNPIWMLIDRKLLSLLRRLPLPESSFTRYNWRGWELADRYRSHHEMGDVFVHVTPGRNWLYLADPDALMHVFRRRTDFPRCLELTEILNVFGPNMSTVDGPKWKSQRKMVATCFNEQNNDIVWSESVRLASDMLKSWGSKPLLTSTAQDARTLSLLVLSRAGFGKSFKFEAHDERRADGPTTSYKDSLQEILENCILITALGPKFLAKPWLPRKFRRLHEACESFQGHMTAMYEEEKRAFAQNRRSEDRNLMTSLVRASQDEAQTAEGLTESEIYGNIFVFNFAGHDTTTHTFTFALYFLAAVPSFQDWLSDELRRVLGDRPPHEWDYSADFPRLKRCLAVMLETVRLYTPVPVAKWTGGESQSLAVGEKVLVLPPKTMVIPSYSSVQTDPKTWGSDSLLWRPSRWIKTADWSDEELVTPRRGTFLGWSEGAPDCLGKKFSHVEFVATIATLFRDWRVDPVAAAGEGLDGARKRVLKQIEDDSAMVLLLQMLHPERSPLVWSKR
ncbi:cytochrome p450 [Hirsutella rhossiliensis]|uniref:Cytochrome p450 domain-containing protein n=1 Tax=Hirsutella rhossiliensis TaxID=111463 RepID=A0A9P8SKC6_9HYPO|nr:cytochrome p450 domain-containing protein [Hirsutella rhossiliensis]KAH0964595.1 cytochrome p450 domain-containing protein [Hirsutella rhossiliensis]